MPIKRSRGGFDIFESALRGGGQRGGGPGAASCAKGNAEIAARTKFRPELSEVHTRLERSERGPNFKTGSAGFMTSTTWQVRCRRAINSGWREICRTGCDCCVSVGCSKSAKRSASRKARCICALWSVLVDVSSGTAQQLSMACPITPQKLSPQVLDMVEAVNGGFACPQTEGSGQNFAEKGIEISDRHSGKTMRASQPAIV